MAETPPSFDDRFVDLFNAHFHRLYRYLDRLSDEPELAADLAQEAFIKLHRRGSLPDAPEAWLISVALNLFRNEKATRSRRRRLLTLSRGEGVHAEPPPSPQQAAAAEDTRRRVRSAIDQLPERERHLLLLMAEGYSYRDIAAVLALDEASVGTLLARARRAFRAMYGDAADAP
ncbi:MAG: sigma-70 family RNA polymerase sigma factor [Gemmatimonadales bacterium]